MAISNKDGAVRAMVGGDNYGVAPFNLATQGQRQPGSSFKPFVLAEALKKGISPNSTWESKKLTYILKGGERFTVNNYDDAYAGVTHARERDGVLRQLGLRAGGQAGRAPRTWPSSPAGWASARRCRATSRSRSAACARA